MRRDMKPSLLGPRETWFPCLPAYQQDRSQSLTQSPRAFWSAGGRPERLIKDSGILWDNGLHFPRKRGFRFYCACLSLLRCNLFMIHSNSLEGGYAATLVVIYS